MDNVLRLNRAFASDKLDALSDDLFRSKQLPCDFVDIPTVRGYEIGGGTYSDKNGFADSIEINTYHINHARKSFGHFINPLVSDTDFAKVVLNMYHEQCHCIQKNYLFRLDDMDESSRMQLVQEIACRENPDYYKNDGNYSINASEIQAEQYGILHAYEYLCDEFPDVDAKQHEKILVDIVNEKMRNFTYFVCSDKPFTSLQEVEDAFDAAYDESFMKNRTYFVQNTRTKDVVKTYMQTHSDAKEVYLNAKDALEKDKCIAAINLKLHPEWLQAYSVLQDMDLSYETIIEKPYQAMINKKTPEQIREEQINQMLHQPVVQSRVQGWSNSFVKKSLSREDALNRLSRKLESSDNMQQSDDYKHDGFV